MRAVLLALVQFGGRWDRVMAWAKAEGFSLQSLPESLSPATEGGLQAVAASPLVELGSHTWNHVDVTRVPPEERAQELSRSASWLLEQTGEAFVTFSYPFGGFDPAVVADVAGDGYALSFLVSGGPFRWSSVKTRPHALPRVNIPRGVSLEGFMARVRGAWPA